MKAGLISRGALRALTTPEQCPLHNHTLSELVRLPSVEIGDFRKQRYGKRTVMAEHCEKRTAVISWSFIRAAEIPDAEKETAQSALCRLCRYTFRD